MDTDINKGPKVTLLSYMGENYMVVEPDADSDGRVTILRDGEVPDPTAQLWVFEAFRFSRRVSGEPFPFRPPVGAATGGDRALAELFREAVLLDLDVDEPAEEGASITDLLSNRFFDELPSAEMVLGDGTNCEPMRFLDIIEHEEEEYVLFRHMGINELGGVVIFRVTGEDERYTNVETQEIWQIVRDLYRERNKLHGKEPK